MNDTESIVLTFQECADRLRCSVRTVRNLARAGHLNGISLTPGSRITTRITAASLRRFVEAAGRINRPRTREDA